METIAERLKSVQITLEQSTLDAHRPSNAVKLLAVSKTKPVSDIVHAYEAGQRLFGENYVQEGVEKIQMLQSLDDIEWYFIGPLQSNKTRLVAENFDWVQAIDRLKIAQRLNDQITPNKILNVCIQVNIDDDKNKAGIGVNELNDFAKAISELPNLRLRGLMTIPKAAQSQAEQTASFAHMAALYDNLKKQYPSVDTLSMGMSGDMQNAINNGSTMVRIGTAIFGRRN
ncbi:YggS family pyridoxal phosphate-dependent enzyme [Paraglaciecola sp. MB-3u-78]|uniref:YggS family pyridoxal phosphate-dependent enzyme n=1 Tax=Paraglaciecola sp. MB-3u-78 TaxID=2058332 RepID=UPI000C34187F|nr:YggS family pyridoxal phosphate-dependent enzyme [Paraglaciecola sp. MB-3u-78]PKG93275.1 YggS family pyridoxal phosphate-dependent enzyme [Paraglaciecola sp. MB-3u-78]